MATSRDVQEIITKLSSDKPKTRDEGIRLLNSWLEGERSTSLCLLLAKNTARIGPDGVPHEESWPFLLTLLTKCIALEISASKKRHPKLLLAKTLRIAIHRAEDPKLSVTKFPLRSVIKLLFNHVWDVVKDVPTFQLEYSGILRLLLSINEYRYQMRHRIYASLLLLYMDKVVSTVSRNGSLPSTSKEEAFRCAQTLHALLENPPGDYPDNIRENVVAGFIEIFSSIRDEGKYSRKLMECINTYLIKDGINLGDLAANLHSTVQEFLFRFWLTTHDRGLKACFILYASIQLKLSRYTLEEVSFAEQLLDVVAKELDQGTAASYGTSWSDASRDDKMGHLGNVYQTLMELAATIFYWSCKETRKIPHQEKKLKMVDAMDRIKDGISKGSWLWNGALCFLTNTYGHRLDKCLLVHWLEGASESLKRLLNNPHIVHSYEALLWLLRALQGLSDILVPYFDEQSRPMHMSLVKVSILAKTNWSAIWTDLMLGLPAFSNVTPVVDAALTLLGNMILQEQVSDALVPHDMWDLRLFKYMSSPSAVYFITCYFSMKGVQGDLRDVYHLRKNLLKASLDLVNLKEPNFLNEHTILLIPAVCYSLTAGYSHLLPFYEKVSIFAECHKDDSDLALLDAEMFECSVETLSVLNRHNPVQVQGKHYRSICIPRQIREPLLHEMEEYISGLMSSNKEFGKEVLGDLINFCSLLCNFVYGLLFSRLREDKRAYYNNLLNNTVMLIDQIAFLIDENCQEVRRGGSVSLGSMFDGSWSTFLSLQRFFSGPLFGLFKDEKQIDAELLLIVQSVEKILAGLARSFAIFSIAAVGLNSGLDAQAHQFPGFQDSNSAAESTLRILDMDLDAENGSRDADSFTSLTSNCSTMFHYPVQCKLTLISVISAFFSVSPVLAWETLSEFLRKEDDAKVSESILYNLCKYFPGSSVSLSYLVNYLHDNLEKTASTILSCESILTCIRMLLRTLLSRCSTIENANVDQYSKDMAVGENLNLLGILVGKIADTGLSYWVARINLIDCICSFVLIEPCIAQTLIGRLFEMLQDRDYRVRIFLARKVGVLFHTWDGHNELFHDICSNFGVELVRTSKERVVKAHEVIALGAQPVLGIESAIITLAHLAFFSEKVEVEAVFMMCVAAAIVPCLRKLAYALLDNLSEVLQYDSRAKYLEELMGSIMARWVACEVSLAKLLEVQELFVTSSEPQFFIRYCCPWLLPPLVLRRDIPNLEWLSKTISQSLPLLAKEYFVPIFAMCMAVYCNERPGKEFCGATVSDSILHVAKVSERERDDLIKRNMVSIVSFLLSLASSCGDTEMPFFPNETIILSVQTVVDGFLEINDHPGHACVVDKINIFRPDRVFKFLLEMHYQISAAIHPRHKRHTLSSIEVLIRTIGLRARVSSTSNYILNIMGQNVGIQPLQDHCCTVLSALLEVFKAEPTAEAINVLGEQLQFLISKLVACCIPSRSRGNGCTIPSSQVINLLCQLTVDADPSLYVFIKDLEPFPELDCLRKIRIFHEDLCKAYSARDRFLMFVRRSPHLPRELLLLSLQSLHKRLLMNEIIPQNSDAVYSAENANGWNSDPEIVNAVWNLVQLIGSDDANDISGLLADFISRVGIGEPYEVVFRLPENDKMSQPYVPSSLTSSKKIGLFSDVCITDDLLISLLRLLNKDLLDNSVKIVDIASQTLQARCTAQIVTWITLNDWFPKVEITLDDPSIWSTEAKTYEMWICSVVHKLVVQCDDVILRLCQAVVLLKADVAELLFPSVLVNLALKNDSSAGMCQLISMKVQENVFVESNGLLKTAQVVLDAMNRLRSIYVNEQAASSFTAKLQSDRTSVSRSRYPTERPKFRTSNMSLLNSSWKKVYWLSLDYLLVARAAIHCGSYFTAIMYVEHWCEEHFDGLNLGSPDFSHMEELPTHIELLVAAFTQINEPDAIYGVIQYHKLASQLITFEHEGNWSKALEYCDLLVRSESVRETGNLREKTSMNSSPTCHMYDGRTINWKYCKGLMKSLQNIGTSHVLDVYSQGLMANVKHIELDSEFTELQYEAAWRAGNWDFSFVSTEFSPCSRQYSRRVCFNESLHSCLRALQEGDFNNFHKKLQGSKTELMLSISNASWEAAEYIHSTIFKLQILYHLGLVWELRWMTCSQKEVGFLQHAEKFRGPLIPSKAQLDWLNIEWGFILRQAQMQMKLLEPSIAFRHAMLKILDCNEFLSEHLLKATTTLRKGSRFSLATAALHELKSLFCQTENETKQHTYIRMRLEEAKILRAQGQTGMGINLAKYLLQYHQIEDEASNIHRLIGKWLAETRSSNSRTILEQYLKHSVELAEASKKKDDASTLKQCQCLFQLAHYSDSLFRSYEERLASNEWQAALRLRKHKTKELEVLIRRLKSSTKGEKTDYSIKIQELQKQLSMDREEAERLQDDRDNFLALALEGYKRCLVIGGKYDLKVVFRIVSLWFSLYMRQNVVQSMLNTAKEVQSYKFLPLVYQIASRLGISKEGQDSFQTALLALLYLVRKMAIEHPYHTIFQILALANGDRIKDKQRNKNSFVVDMDKKLAAENLLDELSSSHGLIIRQMKQMVEIYIKLAELDTKKEDINKKVPLPREVRSIRQLELVPVVTSNITVDPTCQYKEGMFPYFNGLGDSIKIMNGINSPKVVECFGSDGQIYRQLAKSGNDDLRQDAVMEQFFSLVNIFLRNHRDTWKRRLRIRTYKVVPFTPSAGLVEWVDRTVPLGEYLLGSSRNGGAHGRYGVDDWSFLQCREHMTNEKDKRGAFLKVCKNFRPVMRYFFLERFLRPADWFECRLAYTRSVAASSMVGYIVGLGDRHSMNILIDQATAEVVHIDLGVAFEQGLMLKTPERVPFRLTRDIIDGMGVTGVEGVFRRCCEETLAVMRTNKEALLTIIEVFIHDPLYKWALSPLKALQRQQELDDNSDSSLENSEDAYEGNRDAARSILRVKQKLDGYEDGEMRSVAGQVQQLIQDAIDTDRLCQMFPGWGAWL
ncbi:serine/threonine-protein kinase ATM [Phalaenopsis equestris]|uniref:serine/threonine-protein kinase ATM n=1 Tax=Phalaenopsis equestris TaxID=78828 RepID=UPI0009E41339|nr:serine/threonine-protein kinase ATM [Phalaenopsis equestris]